MNDIEPLTKFINDNKSLINDLYIGYDNFTKKSLSFYLVSIFTFILICIIIIFSNISTLEKPIKISITIVSIIILFYFFSKFLHKNYINILNKMENHYSLFLNKIIIPFIYLYYPNSQIIDAANKEFLDLVSKSLFTNNNVNILLLGGIKLNTSGRLLSILEITSYSKTSNSSNQNTLLNGHIYIFNSKKTYNETLIINKKLNLKPNSNLKKIHNSDLYFNIFSTNEVYDDITKAFLGEYSNENYRNKDLRIYINSNQIYIYLALDINEFNIFALPDKEILETKKLKDHLCNLTNKIELSKNFESVVKNF